MSNNIILTGDRPTGSLHLGHYVGSLRKRVELQNTGKFDQFVMIADLQALTDNADNPEKIRQNILEVMLDYLAVGLEPDKTTFFVQSHIPALYELPMYYSNLVTMSRLERNPTIKSEIKMRNFERNLPVGFMTYPISQTADITAFKAKYVPVGEDQLPMLEQAREIVNSFNRIYKCDILVEPEAVLPDNASCNRLVGTDGNTSALTSSKLILYSSQSPLTSSSVKPKNSARFPGSVMEYSMNIFSAECEPYFLIGKIPVIYASAIYSLSFSQKRRKSKYFFCASLSCSYSRKQTVPLIDQNYER